jgi:hypothetical protein
MAIEPGALVVILLYVLSLIVVLVVSPRLIGAKAAPWWRSVRFWSSLVAIVQIIVYAVWG